MQLRKSRSFGRSFAAGALLVAGCAASGFAAIGAFGGFNAATAQSGEQTRPEVFVGLFIEGCVWTAPEFRDAKLVFEREGLRQSPVIFDRELFVGPTNLVSAAVEDDETTRRCRLVGRGVDEQATSLALGLRLEAEFGALLARTERADGGLGFRAPVAGAEVTIEMVLAEPGEEPRAMILATIDK